MSGNNTSNGEPAATQHVPRKLVLCFDGTGNTFTGSNADTNVVKLLSKLDRNTQGQFHYYQTGIGTYDINEKSVNKSWLGELNSSISQTLDQAVGMTFDAHVMAGYRFLMRYYESGDKIYMFGFSRGAFTAKFLARMINTVGLLCKGNEEMVPFAFRLYQRYLAGEVEDFMGTKSKGEKSGAKKGAKKKKQRSQTNGGIAVDNETAPLLDCDGDSNVRANGNANGYTNGDANGHVNGHVNGEVNGSAGLPIDESEIAPGSNGSVAADGKQIKHHGRRWKRARDEITAFSSTFCRKEDVIDCNGKTREKNIKVFFLGLWDCVNSVAVLEREAPIPVPVKGTAHYVRHAVAVDERRVKFKAALLAQDMRASSHDHEDIKEVWFPGCHGDVGGGWPATEDNKLDHNDVGNMTYWERIKNFWTSRKATDPSKHLEDDPLQLSDVALAWMIRELELVGKKEPDAALTWRRGLKKFKERVSNMKESAMGGFIHDSLSFGCGTAFFKVLLWKFMEYLPIIKRWELENNTWVNVRFPLNKGLTRDIPKDAVLHESLLWRLRNDPDYHPQNNHGGKDNPCLKCDGKLADLVGHDVEASNKDHKTFKFRDDGSSTSTDASNAAGAGRSMRKRNGNRQAV